MNKIFTLVFFFVLETEDRISLHTNSRAYRFTGRGQINSEILND